MAALVCMPAPPARGEEEFVPRWGIGWYEGICLRKLLGGGWEVGLAGGPNDRLFRSERQEWDTEYEPENQGVLQAPNDDRRESGWVRLDVGRSIWSVKRLTLCLFTAVNYTWEVEQDNSRTFSQHSERWQDRVQEEKGRTWRLWLGLRPSILLHERVTAGFHFGLEYSWDREWSHRRSSYSGGEEEPRESGEDSSYQSDSFDLFGGWYGFGSLHFIFWL